MVRESARAKINLTLDILGTRADGYHEVSMIMQTIELADAVELEKTSGGISLKMHGRRRRHFKNFAEKISASR